MGNYLLHPVQKSKQTIGPTYAKLLSYQCHLSKTKLDITSNVCQFDLLAVQLTLISWVEMPDWATIFFIIHFL